MSAKEDEPHAYNFVYDTRENVQSYFDTLKFKFFETGAEEILYQGKVVTTYLVTGELPVLQEPVAVIQDIISFFDSIPNTPLSPTMIPLKTLLKHTEKPCTTSPLYVSCIIRAFALATVNSWKNESAKSFLSDIWPFLFDIKHYYADMGTQSTDYSFKIDLMYDKSGKATSQTRRSSRISKSTETSTSADSNQEPKSNSTRYNKGVRKPDFTLIKRLLPSRKPFILFEVKSSSDLSNTFQGVAQLLSFGIGVRHNEKLEHSLYLVLINPVFWGMMVLPPFGEEWNGIIKFHHIPMFSTPGGGNVDVCFLFRENLIWVLQFLNETANGKQKFHLD